MTSRPPRCVMAEAALSQGTWVSDDDGAIHEVVEPENRFSLHVGLVVHGREVCTYRNPRCGECVLKAEGLCGGVA